MAARAALVDPDGKVAHARDAVGDLVAEEHPAAARLGALPHDDLDRIAAPQVVRVHPVAGRKHLVDERRRVRAFLLGHPAVAGRRRRADLARPAAEGLLRRRGKRAEAHSRDRDRDLQLERLARVSRTEDDVRAAFFAVALERIPRDARAEDEEIVEVREPSLRAETADVVDPLACSALDLRDDVAVVQVRLAEPGMPAVLLRHQYSPAWSTWKL